MYRDDLAATHARVDQLQRELDLASAASVQDKQRIAALTAQLASMQQTLARLDQERAIPYAYSPGAYTLPSRSGTILTLGILSLVVCSVMGPIAWSMGNDELRRIDAGHTSPDGRANAAAGRICGIISSAFLILGGFLILMMLVIGS